MGHDAIPIPVRLVILLCCQGPAELIKVLFDKSTFHHLQAGVRGELVLQGCGRGFWGGNGGGKKPSHLKSSLDPQLECKRALPHDARLHIPSTGPLHR